MNGRLIVGLSLALTVGWLGLLAYLTGLTEPCQAEAGFIQAWLACRTTNELGDFFAGVFAPLAFIWLVATVFIQSSALNKQGEELRLARREQKLIRDEMKLTRVATEARLEAARMNIELFQKQIQIEHASSAMAREKSNDNAFQKILEAALDNFQDNISGKRAYVYKNKTVDVPQSKRSKRMTEKIMAAKLAISQLQDDLLSIPQSERPKISGHAHWNELRRQLNEAKNLLPQCTLGFRLLVDETALQELSLSASIISNTEEK